MPLASTAPFAQGVAGSLVNTIKYGAEPGAGTAPQVPNLTTQQDGPGGANYLGQDGDGYGQIVQILPYIEEAPLYDKLTMPVNSGGRSRLGKLNDPAFAADNYATNDPGRDSDLHGNASRARPSV